jgi:hypothetical protein
MEDLELESRMVEYGINPEIAIMELSEKEKEDFFGSNTTTTLNFDLKLEKTV